MAATSIIVVEAIRAIGIVIREKKECELFRQQIVNANKILIEAAENQEDIIMIFEAMANMVKNGSLKGEAAQKTIRHLAQLFRDQLAFDEACISILD